MRILIIEDYEPQRVALATGSVKKDLPLMLPLMAKKGDGMPK